MGMISSANLLTVVLIVFALLWIKEVALRLRSDVLEFKSTDEGAVKLVIVFWWLLTMLVIWWLITSVVGIASRTFG